jgi:arylsulfatase A-like enzyme
MAGILALLLAALLACTGPGPVDVPAEAPAKPAERHVVLISLDGLRPEFYLDPAYPAPTLRALAASGSHARRAEPVFPTMTYPNHATIVTGVRPARHGVLFNAALGDDGTRGRPYEEADDLRVPPLWEWARAAGLRTAGVNWPSTYHARIEFLLPERDYYARPRPVELLVEAATPGLFELARVTPAEATVRDVAAWDAFLAETSAGIVRAVRPHLLLLHLVQTDIYQHRQGRGGEAVKDGVARVDAHVASILGALREAGLGERTVVVVTGDHGFQDVRREVFPNHVLARAGLRGCPRAGEAWRATAHIAGGAAAVFVNPRDDAEAARTAETALRAQAGDAFTILSRAELDALGAMVGAAFALEATPGHVFGGACDRGLSRAASGGSHGFLPSRATMATGFIASGDGVQSGLRLDSVRLIDIAPTVARLLGVPTSPVEGRVLTEILR